MSHSTFVRPAWLRGAARLLVTAFTVTVSLNLPMTALAQRAQKAQTQAAKDTEVGLVTTPPLAKRLAPSPALKQNLKPLTPEQAKLLASRVPHGKRLTFLNEVGRLVRPIATSQVTVWQKDLSASHSAAQKAAAHVHLGEWELAQNEQPERALSHFRQAQRLVKHSDSIYGLATYDSALVLFDQGAYRASATAFRALLASKETQNGFDRPLASRFLRHAAACADYHAERSAAGIPEPPQLDPLCAASGLAVALRSLGQKYDRQTILAHVRHTGLGSSNLDIIQAARKLGFAAHNIFADEKGLIGLPKPLIAHVEHDHFITVTADKDGVTYLCSDCGAWPGGSVRLNWKQWRMLEANSYVAICRRGSVLDNVLSNPQTAHAVRPSVQLASARPLSGGIQALTLANLLKSHVFLYTGQEETCGRGMASTACPCDTQCPTDQSGNQSGSGAGNGGSSDGDPVNLATGEEEYSPAPDLTVYNPAGPAVSFSRTYNSLRPPHDETQALDFGYGWSHNYNIGVVTDAQYLSNPGGFGSPIQYYDALIFPNGSRYLFTRPATPSVSSPIVHCTVQGSHAVLIDWVYDDATHTHFAITFKNRTRYITYSAFTVTGQHPSSSISWHPLKQIVDALGNAITFNYTQPNSGDFPLLSSVSNPNTTLLTISRASDGSITQIADCYGRSVYYECGVFSSTAAAVYNTQLVHVSQTVATNTTNPPLRYTYGYSRRTGNPRAFLHTITVPSPTGSGDATTTINYDQSNDYVTSIVDANGNERDYAATDGTHTQVTVKDSNSNTVYTYTAAFDSLMRDKDHTNGGTANQSTKTFAGAYPYSPDTVTDANSKTWTYTYDQWGNVLTSLSPRQVLTTYTYDYTHFAMGELTQVVTQDGNATPKTATQFDYYEPSGLMQDIYAPKPGKPQSDTVTYSYTYDLLGNVLTETGPGNDAVTTIVTTYGYEVDGTYSQTAAMHQPLTRTDNLGHVTHMRYDAQGNLTSVKDALGNQTTLTYNIANQLAGMTFPATTNDSNVTGSASLAYTYLYPGGPKTSEIQKNESGTNVWQVDMRYGGEGEMLSRTGSTQPYEGTYDPLYRLSTLKDGNNGTPTKYFYNARGYLGLVVYPGFVDNTTASYLHYDATNDKYTVDSGHEKDTVQLPLYDDAGNLTKRIDGKGVVMQYDYSTDAESKLTAVSYPASTSLNVTLSYDGFGRVASVTDKSGVQAFDYDDRDNKTTVNTTYNKVGATGTLPQISVTYAYNDDGSLYQLQTTGGDFTYGYDGAGRLTSLSNPAGQAWSWSYLNNNWLHTQTAGIGSSVKVATSVSRNARGFVTQLLHQTGAALPSTYAQYDVGYSNKLTLGHVTASLPTAINPTGSSALSGDTYYTHDSKLQLTQEQTNRPCFAGSNSSATNTFAYDGAGNPTTFRSTNGATFNADNQRTGVTYDGNGNPGSWNGNTCSYDAENRLTSLQSSTLNDTFGYRADGLRAWKQKGSASSGLTYYIYDGEMPLFELDSTGAITTTTTWSSGQALARSTTGGRTLLLVSDVQGNVGQQVNASSGSVVEAYGYDAWGARVAKGSDTAAQADGLSGYGGSVGYYTDSESGLTLCGHRYYDSASGRWLTRDPADYTGGINLYQYVGSSPVSEHDATGLAFSIGGALVVFHGRISG